MSDDSAASEAHHTIVSNDNHLVQKLDIVLPVCSVHTYWIVFACNSVLVLVLVLFQTTQPRTMTNQPPNKQTNKQTTIHNKQPYTTNEHDTARCIQQRPNTRATSKN